MLAGIPALLFALVIYGYLALPDVRSLAIENPAMTAFMQLRAEQAREQGHTARRVRRWVSYPHMSPELRRAVLLAACIINPRAMNPSRPSTRLVRRERLILDRMMRSSTSAAGRSGRPGASSRVTDELVVHLDTPPRRS
jgi:membrane peptidoglycan carboxypeptidase